LRAFAKRAGHTVAGVFKETASGARNDRVERNKVMVLARNREIDSFLVTELSRWGRSTQDLVQTDYRLAPDGQDHHLISLAASSWPAPHGFSLGHASAAGFIVGDGT
jgi:DNA invertase Pin-like site-specific DNA recombinase